MTTHEPKKEAEALDAYLHGNLPADHPDLPKAEAELGVALKSAAQEIQPSAQFEAELERSLMREAQRKPSSLRRSLAYAGRTAAWAGLVVVLLVGLSWVFRTLLPGAEPGAGPTENASPVAVLPGVTEAPSVIKSAVPDEPTQAATQPASPTTYRLPMLQNAEVIVQAEFPEAPGEVQLYQQKAWPELSAESALQAAQQLGVEGQLYTSPAGPPGATSYLVSDEFARVTFNQAAPWYQYQPASSVLTPQQALAASQAILQAQGLGNFEYQAETQPNASIFTQTLDDIPVSFPPFNAPEVRLALDDQGLVSQVDSSLVDFEALGSYPIITAQEAWEKVLSPDTPGGLETYSISGGNKAFQNWERVYPLEHEVELFGYAQSYPSVDPGLPPLVFFKDHPVSGNIQGLAEAAVSNRFIQAWGYFEADEQERLIFKMTGWQSSFFPDQNLQGAVKREGDQVYLVTSDQHLRLPDAPENLPDGMTIAVQGVVLDDPEPIMEWSNLYTAPLGGGGGGGGNFAELNLEGPPITPVQPAPLEPTPSPVFYIGKRLEGVQGQVMIFINQPGDESSQVEILINLDPGPEWPEGFTIKLDGPGLAGIDAYHNLPVRVWGEISDDSGILPTLSVERFEPAYPGLKVEAWLGLLEAATVGEQQVLLFTTQDGEQYVLNSSIESPGAEELPGPASDPVVVEGILIPGQTLGDYPVLTDYLFLPMSGMNDLSEYTPMSVSPMITQREGSAGERGKGVIDQVELVYYTADPRYAAAEAVGSPAYAQPAWRFSGRFEDGSTFVILVQALRSEYLK